MNRVVFAFATMLGLCSEVPAGITLENQVDACGCWTAEYASLEGITVSGDLDLTFDLGAIRSSGGRSLRVQLRHASSANPNGTGSEWLIPQLTNGLARDATGNLVWHAPKGVSIPLGKPSRIFTGCPGTDLMARTAHDGRIEIRCPHAFTYRFREYALDEVEAGSGEIYRARTRGGLIEELRRIEPSGDESIVLAAGYDRYARVVRLVLHEREHHFEYSPGSRRMTEWLDQGRKKCGRTTFGYDENGLLRRIAGVIDCELEWRSNPLARRGAGPRSARPFAISRNGDLQYRYEVAGGIVTLTAIVSSGRTQRMYYNLRTGNIDLFDP